MLHLVGLFDRPAKRELIRALRRPPVIEDLNDQLVGQSDHKWKRTLPRLRSAKLIVETLADELDAHPLVREYFGERLKVARSEAWRAGHGRLYEHLRDSTEEYPDTRSRMARLYQAMHHGCQAGRHQEVLAKVYWARISRRDFFYSTKKLGAYGEDLAAIAGVFELPWTKTVATVTEDFQAFILNQAAIRLGSLGRLREAGPPMRAGLERRVAQEDWRNATNSAINLCELLLLLGEVTGAVAMAEASLGYADRSGEELQRRWSRGVNAYALHQSGAPARAKELFEEAEALQAEREPHYPRLYSVVGYYYCDLLLAQGRAAEAQERAVQALEWALQDERGTRLDVALNHLALGQAALALGEQGEAKTQLHQAVDGLRQAGKIDYLPYGLLARTALFREVGKLGRAREDLDEAMRIARRSEMRLFQCDAHLEYARLALAEGNTEQAREHVAAARRLVDEASYGRRRPEVEELEAKVR